MKKLNLPLLFTISAAILTFTLGSWQVYRLQWKSDLIEITQKQMQKPAINLPKNLNDIEKLQYRKIKLKGQFLHEHEIHLFTGAKVLKGKAGYNLITPLKTNNGNVILVDRGWIPAQLKEDKKRISKLDSQKQVEIVGMFHNGEVQKGFTPDNDIENNIWFWIDVKTIRKLTNITEIPNLYIRSLKGYNESEDIYPLAGDAQIKRRNDHLHYAFTWYSFCIISLIIYFLYYKTNMKTNKKQN